MFEPAYVIETLVSIPSVWAKLTFEKKCRYFLKKIARLQSSADHSELVSSRKYFLTWPGTSRIC